MSRQVLEQHIGKEDAMGFPTEYPDADRHHGRNRESSAQQHPPLPVQAKSGENAYRPILDGYEHPQAYPGECLTVPAVEIVSK